MRSLATAAAAVALLVATGCSGGGDEQHAGAGGQSAGAGGNGGGGGEPCTPTPSGAVPVKVAVAADCAFLLLSDGRVMSWGDNWSGCLGLGRLNAIAASKPRAFSDFGGAVDVVANSDGGCALLSTGVPYCWGSNEWGEVGSGNGAPAASPVPVYGETDVTHIWAGGPKTCDKHTDGVVMCWGATIGDGTNDYTAVPTATTFPEFGDASLGSTFYLVALDGTLYGWGAAIDFVFGPETEPFRYSPGPLPGLPPIKQVSDGGVGCSVTDMATVWCWGGNSYGGTGSSVLGEDAPPAEVSDISDAVAVATGYWHACSLLADKTMRCWGAGDTLGIGTEVDTHVPVSPTGMTGVEQISANQQVTCAVKSDHSVWCWGFTFRHVLGPDGLSLSPMEIDWQSGLAEADCR